MSATKPSPFDEAHPLDFRMLDERERKPVLFIEEALVDGSAEDDALIVRFTNVSSKVVALRNPDGAPMTHFTLLFRPSTLAASSVKTRNGAFRALDVRPKLWSAMPRQLSDGSIAVDFERLQPEPLNPGEAFELKIKKLRAAEEGGSRPSNVELRYGAIFFPEDGSEVHGFRTKRLRVEAAKDRPLPVHVGFVNGDRILNDGITENTVTLRLTNIAPDLPVRFVPESKPGETKISLTFDLEAPGISKHWAIGTVDDMKDFVLTPPPGWRVRVPADQAETRVWSLTPAEGTPALPRAAALDFVLSRIRSSSGPGAANVYLSIENIPGFSDASFVCTLEKSPLVYPGRNVGIGVIPPVTKSSGNLVLHGDLHRSISGGGTVSWRDGRLRWSKPFRAADAIEIAMPSAAIPNTAVHDGIVRALVEGGLPLRGGESLYARWDAKNTASFEILRSGPIRSESVLVASVDGDGKHVRLGNGVVLPDKGASTDGSPVLRGTVIMWSGSESDIPEGWVICNSQEIDGFRTPDLRGKFIVGWDPGDGEYQRVGNQGGRKAVQLAVADLPPHPHSGSTSEDGGHTHAVGTDQPNSPIPPGDTQAFFQLGSGNKTFFLRVGHLAAGAHQHTFSTDMPEGVTATAHENRPPYYVLVYLVKL